jgi:hypothetical protein
VSFPKPFDIAAGLADGWRSIKVDGRNIAVAQSYVPICQSGFYRVPQAGVNLRIRAGGNANDTAAGSGAREIEIYGLNESGLEITERLATAGASASAQTVNKFLRVMDVKVTKSGTYATQAAGSHVGNINIEAANGDLWATIPLNGFPESRARIGAFTIPANYEGFLIGVKVNADAGKTVDALVFERENILEKAAPYSAMSVVTEIFNASGFTDIAYDAPIRIAPLTDIGVLAKVDNQTARVGVGLGLLLRRIA